MLKLWCDRMSWGGGGVRGLRWACSELVPQMLGLEQRRWLATVVVAVRDAWCGPARVQVVLPSQGEAVQAGRQLVMQRRAHTVVSPASTVTAGHQGGWRLTKAGQAPRQGPGPCACQHQAGHLPDQCMHWGASVNRHASPKPGGLRATQTFASLPNFPKAACRSSSDTPRGKPPAGAGSMEVMLAHNLQRSC